MALMDVLQTMTVGVIPFEGVSNALEFFGQIAANFRLMRTQSVLSFIIWVMLTLSLFFAMLILIVRVGYEAPWTRNLVAAFYSNTSIDLFALGSFGIVRVEDTPKNWITVVLYAVGVGILPMTIVIIFHLFGFNIL